MKLYEVSTSSGHTWIVRALGEQAAIGIAFEGETDDSPPCAKALGYERADLAPLEFALDGEPEILQLYE